MICFDLTVRVYMEEGGSMQMCICMCIFICAWLEYNIYLAI